MNNRPSDVDLTIKNAMLPFNSSTQTIHNLLSSAQNFQNNQARWNLPYAPVPTGLAGTYNSNSFAHGLLRAVGVSNIPNVTGAPGWGRPIASHYFNIPLQWDFGYAKVAQSLY